MAKKHRSNGWIFALFLSVFSSGCSTTRYLLQASRGQLALIHHARPIEVVLKDERVLDDIKKLLSEVNEIKSFGEKNGLKATKNYSDYVDLKRDRVVTVVTASRPLKFDSKKWYFPIVGSFNYLGWFDRADAEADAEKLRSEGWDVDLRGASAFSTLGWFKDPILSTMLGRGNLARFDLVNVVLHESVHATVYIPDQSLFNESLASFVADELSIRYFEEKEGKSSETIRLAKDSEKEHEDRKKLFHETYLKLDQLYQSHETDEEKVRKKGVLFEELKRKTGIKRQLNNGSLIGFKTYSSFEKDFESLFHVCGKDLNRFLGRMANLRKKDFKDSQSDDLREVISKIRNENCQ